MPSQPYLPTQNSPAEFVLPLPPAGVVAVERYQPDFENLFQPTEDRIKALQHHPCYYVNPLVTVTSLKPTRAFFRTVRRCQADWIRRTKTCFSRRVRRRVARWVTDEASHDTKHYRYVHRSLCLTGVLVLNGDLIPAQLWARFESPQPSSPRTLTGNHPLIPPLSGSGPTTSPSLIGAQPVPPPAINPSPRRPHFDSVESGDVRKVPESC